MTYPKFIYGTAWKEDQTEALVTKALDHGFRAFDTANQRRHYVEAAVGNAISKAMVSGIKRDDLFIQTKFTSIGGQDHRLPYDANADGHTQVQQSFQSSLDHLNIDYIDSYILHGPSQSIGLSSHDIQVWREMERLKNSGQVTI